MTRVPPKRRISKLLNQPNILVQIMGVLSSLTAKAQSEFVDTLAEVASRMEELLSGQIRRVERSHDVAWKGVRHRPIAFVDGGMASLEDLGSEPLAVRVGTYVVIPGESGDGREVFGFAQQMVAELFEQGSGDSLFEDFSENAPKLRDAARMTLERAGALGLAHERPDLAYMFVHGSLVDPVAPYWGGPDSTAGVPAFSIAALQRMGISIAKVEEVVGKRQGNECQHLVSIQRYLVNSLFRLPFPVTGIVERASPSRIVTAAILDELEIGKSIANKEARQLKELMRDYRISDTILFGCLLEEGQYIVARRIDKNAVSKSPDVWKTVLAAFDQPWTTYVRPTEEVLPFRVETTLVGTDPSYAELMRLVVHMSRLLPRYGFPVGLDIVDRHAKIPAWMSRQIRRELSAGLLRIAMESKDPRQLQIIRNRLLMQKRDIFFRPGTDW